jgi:hypothetical protein
MQPCAEEKNYLSKVGLGHGVTFVAIFVTAGLLAELAVKSQLGETLGLDPVEEIVNPRLVMLAWCSNTYHRELKIRAQAFFLRKKCQACTILCKCIKSTRNEPISDGLGRQESILDHF